MKKNLRLIIFSLFLLITMLNLGCKDVENPKDGAEIPEIEIKTDYTVGEGPVQHQIISTRKHTFHFSVIPNNIYTVTLTTFEGNVNLFVYEGTFVGDEKNLNRDVLIDKFQTADAVKIISYEAENIGNTIVVEAITTSHYSLEISTPDSSTVYIGTFAIKSGNQQSEVDIDTEIQVWNSKEDIINRILRAENDDDDDLKYSTVRLSLFPNEEIFFRVRQRGGALNKGAYGVVIAPSSPDRSSTVVVDIYPNPVDKYESDDIFIVGLDGDEKIDDSVKPSHIFFDDMQFHTLSKGNDKDIDEDFFKFKMPKSF